MLEDNACPLNTYSITACELPHLKRNSVMELLHGYDFVMSYIQSQNTPIWNNV